MFLEVHNDNDSSQAILDLAEDVEDKNTRRLTNMTRMSFLQLLPDSPSLSIPSSSQPHTPMDTPSSLTHRTSSLVVHEKLSEKENRENEKSRVMRRKEKYHPKKHDPSHTYALDKGAAKGEKKVTISRLNVNLSDGTDHSEIVPDVPDQEHDPNNNNNEDETNESPELAPESPRANLMLNQSREFEFQANIPGASNTRRKSINVYHEALFIH